MIITKEEQGKLVEEYAKTHDSEQILGFIDGMKAMMELVDEKLKQEKLESL